MKNKIEISVKGSFFEGLEVSQEEIDSITNSVIEEVTFSFQNKIRENVNNTLHSTKNIYLQHLKSSRVKDGEVVVSLDLSNPLVKAIEEGGKPFDMKEGFLKSSKAKISKDGKRYMTIPFRHKTPNSKVDVKMPNSIYRIAKSQNIEDTNRGIKLSELPKEFQIKSVNSQGYEHKAPIYEGIVKTMGSSEGRSQYFSFRRVSENSDPKSWMNKGISARNIFDKTLSTFDIDKEVGVEFDKIIEERFS